MIITQKDIDQYLFQLEHAPQKIADCTRDVDESLLHGKTSAGDWSPNDILAHLRSCADVWGNSIEAMLAADYPSLPDIHPRAWIKQTDYLVLPFNQSLREFLRQRKKLLLSLKSLSFGDWSRAAIIGKREHTIFSQTRRMAKHEAEHMEQIKTLIRRIVDRR